MVLHIPRTYAASANVLYWIRYAGYVSSVIGSIIANQGFIDQFATVTNAEGVRELSTTHISLWQAINFVFQIVIQLIAPITADRFGRKFNMWALTLFLTLVSEHLRTSTPS